MRLLIIMVGLVGVCNSQALQKDFLERDKIRFSEIISTYQDSLRLVENKIEEIEKEDFEQSLSEGRVLLYTLRNAPLRTKPFPGAELVKELPLNTKMALISKVRSYWEVETSYGKGFISEIHTQGSPSNTDKYTSSSTQKKYSSSLTNKSEYRRASSSPSRTYSRSRTYIRGPRGGCYYINSNGNKSYVARSLCN